jgi:hypothetical protein
LHKARGSGGQPLPAHEGGRNARARAVIVLPRLAHLGHGGVIAGFDEASGLRVLEVLFPPPRGRPYHLALRAHAHVLQRVQLVGLGNHGA